MTKISIITPVLNGEKYLRATVDSVLGQTGDFALEYLVRDGGSTDGTLAILKEYGDRVQVVSERDGSPTAAINAGMRMATGDIVAWLNADDVYEPGALQRVVTAFARHPRRHWAYGYCSIMDENGQEMRGWVTTYKSVLGYWHSRNLLLCENYVNQPATFWRRALWSQAGDLECGYKAAFDYQQWLRFARLSRAIPIHARLARFRRHPGSISENQFARQFDEELVIARQFGSPLHVAIHWVNRWKIVWSYRLLTRLGR